jgi:hypothetical protein
LHERWPPVARPAPNEIRPINLQTGAVVGKMGRRAEQRKRRSLEGSIVISGDIFAIPMAYLMARDYRETRNAGALTIRDGVTVLQSFVQAKFDDFRPYTVRAGDPPVCSAGLSSRGAGNRRYFRAQSVAPVGGRDPKSVGKKRRIQRGICGSGCCTIDRLRRYRLQPGIARQQAGREGFVKDRLGETVPTCLAAARRVNKTAMVGEKCHGIASHTFDQATHDIDQD